MVAIGVRRGSGVFGTVVEEEVPVSRVASSRPAFAMSDRPKAPPSPVSSARSSGVTTGPVTDKIKRTVTWKAAKDGDIAPSFTVSPGKTLELSIVVPANVKAVGVMRDGCIVENFLPNGNTLKYSFSPNAETASTALIVSAYTATSTDGSYPDGSFLGEMRINIEVPSSDELIGGNDPGP